MKVFMKFSNIEKEHLLKAWLAIGLAFSILISGDFFSIGFLISFLISLFTVGLGFLFHELAHKLVAQKYNCFAEFRANDKMLIFGILSAFFGFIFIAPGAVFIKGNVSIEKNGKISLMGPLANFILSIVFFIFMQLFSQFNFLKEVFYYGFQVNSFLALFNLIPFFNFDGEKILKWNKFIYFIFLFCCFFVIALKFLFY